MTHPMKPTPEQLTEWLSAALQAHPSGKPALIAGYVAHQAFAAGADAELEECEELLRTGFPGSLRMQRRPVLQTPREQALEALNRLEAGGTHWLYANDLAIIRQGLEDATS